ncbi:hypothetical protein HZB94_04670 [Candidatus Falkowbacteria bacterium]|nr:hypothetical protein [Candidatus Falkowbacteria bacterium]
MAKKFLVIIILTILFCGLFSFVVVNAAEETAQDKALKGLDKTAIPAGFSTETKDPSLVIGKMIKAMLGALGIVFLIITVYGGVQWMTAAGAPDDVKQARNMIIEGAIGLAVCLASYSFAYYAVKQLSEAAGM